MSASPPSPDRSAPPTWRVAGAIAAKDLRLRLRDRSAFVVGFLAPFGLALVMTLTFGGAGDDFGFRFAVADEDGGPVASEFLTVLDALEEEGEFVFERAATAEAARVLADDDEVSAAFVLPAGSSDAVQSGAGASLVVVANPQAQIGADVAEAIASGFAARLDAVSRSVATVAAIEGATDPGRIAELADQAASLPPPLALDLGATEDEGFDFATYYAVGIAVFFLFFTVQFGVLGIVEERDAGTLARLLAAPVSPAAVVLGKLGTAFVLGVVSMAVLVVSTSVVLGADWGAPLPVAVLVVCGVLAAMGIVAVVGGLARDARRAEGATSFVAVVLAVFGGSFFRVDFGPDFLDVLSRITPHRWLLDGFRDLGAGAGVADVVPNVVALLTMAAVLGGVGLWLAGRMVRR